MNWMQSLFGVEKPIIGMAHFKPLPGDPNCLYPFDARSSADLLLEDIISLQKGGVDGIMFSNEGSQPWVTNPKPITTTAMAAILGLVLSNISIPFGVHVIWDPKATIDLAAAVESNFAWEVFTGVYASDYGLWNTNIGKYIRHQKQLHAENIKLLFEIVPEAAVYLSSRSLKDLVRTNMFNSNPDAFCVAGLKPGEAASLDGILEVKEISSNIPVLASTGVKATNVISQLEIADGAIVGSAFKKNGNLWNLVDSTRVKKLMDIVKTIRKRI
jgi:uncharacterized protein